MESLHYLFYPGALVEPESYSIWAQDLAKTAFSRYCQNAT